MPAAGCVRNAARLDGQQQLLIASGSNMSGKSTLLRTVGANAVLAMAGAPVRALRLRLPAANVHFADQHADGTMTFDYQMRPGVLRSGSGLAILRALGINV